MHGRIYAGLVLFSLLMVIGGGAQSPTDDKPVWTMEFIKVKQGMFGPTLRYLDSDWMRVQEVAKQQGVVLTYSRIADKPASFGDLPVGVRRTIVLLTEFKNQEAYEAREKTFASIRNRLPDKVDDVVKRYQPEDLFESDTVQVFNDLTDTGVRFQLLSKN